MTHPVPVLCFATLALGGLACAPVAPEPTVKTSTATTMSLPPLNPGDGYWALDDAPSGVVAADAATIQHPAAFVGKPAWTVGKVDGAVHFNGISDCLETHAAVVDTGRSFSAAAWVQLQSLNGFATAVSQDGNNVSGFYLQYIPVGQLGAPNGGFAMAMLGLDRTDSSPQRAVAGFTPVLNTWYHLAGVYDASSSTMILYVNGQMAAQKQITIPWTARGQTALGRGWFNGKPADYWPGRLDEVHVAAHAYTAAEVSTLFAQGPQSTPLRAPAVPLIVRSPYLSTWMRSDSPATTWPSFWNGFNTGMQAVVRVDNIPYRFIGAGGGTPYQTATVQQVEITPTQSRYVFQAGPVTLYADFVSPVESDIKTLSAPFGYLYFQAQSTDGNTHRVQLYTDISGEWANGNNLTPISWSFTNGGAASVSAFAVNSNVPATLTEYNDQASWGTIIFAARGPSMTFSAGPDINVRALMASQGALDNSIDTNMPRAIQTNWPVFAYSFDLGNIAGTATAPVVLALGYARTPAVSYLGMPLPPLWQSYWDTWQGMLTDAYADASNANGVLARANALDDQVLEDATSAGGVHYAALCALALRQAYGAIEPVGSSTAPEFLLKEISSDGNVSTVDVLYPTMPVFLYNNPEILRMLLLPVLTYAESGNWPEVFPPHDLGASYPNASGHNDGGGENMPVEESANMLLMVDAYAQAVDTATGNAFVTAHYPTLRGWAEYLVANLPDPNFQNQTDDFTGPIAHSSNLALKGILALGAMSNLANRVGTPADVTRYGAAAVNDIGVWVTKSTDSSGTHLKLAYDQDGTWSLKYNAYVDRLLGLNLVPGTVTNEEVAWYSAHAMPYGIPLDNRHTYTKLDWMAWTAAATDDPNFHQLVHDSLYAYATSTPQRIPLTDWFDASAGTQSGFMARSVVGGVFATLARAKSGH